VPSRPQRPRRPEPEPDDRVVVKHVDDMLALPFRQHVQVRHARTMRYRTRTEHEADHRLHDDVLDHTHSEARGLEEEPEGEQESTQDD
jgi:hypothetical protein